MFRGVAYDGPGGFVPGFSAYQMSGRLLAPNVAPALASCYQQYVARGLSGPVPESSRSVGACLLSKVVAPGLITAVQAGLLVAVSVAWARLPSHGVFLTSAPLGRAAAGRRRARRDVDGCGPGRVGVGQLPGSDLAGADNRGIGDDGGVCTGRPVAADPDQSRPHLAPMSRGQAPGPVRRSPRLGWEGR